MLLALSCADVTVSDQRPPDAVTHVAVIQLDANGAPEATSPLRPYRAGAPLWLQPEQDRELLLLGYGEAALRDPVTGALPEAIEAAPVTLATACDPTLPPPLWVARVRGDVISDGAPEDAPLLTAQFLLDRCRLPEDAELDVRGGEGPRCLSTTSRVGPCALRIESGGCAITATRLSYVGDQIRCAEVETLECEPVAQRSLLSCEPQGNGEPWEIQIVPAGFDEAPRFTTASARFGLLPAAPHPAVGAGRSPTLDMQLYDWGQGFEVLPLEDRAVITAIDSDDRNPCSIAPPPPPRPSRSRRMVFVDLETVQVTGSATAPDCLERLAPALDGAGFVGGFTDADGAPMLGRFAPDGRRSSQVALAPGVEGLVRLIVALPSLYVVQLDPSELVFVRPDLSLAGRYAPDGLVFGLSAVGPDRVAGWVRRDAPGSDVRVIRVPSGEVVDRLELSILDAFRATTSIAARDTYVLLATDDRKILTYGLDPLTYHRVIGTVGREPGYVVSAVPWPAAPTALAVGGGASGGPDEYRPALFFLDYREERFLAGDRPLEGIGPISSVRTDAAGRVWALLPWEGTVVRIIAQDR